MVSAFSKVAEYNKLSKELRSYLESKPNDWENFQSIFNVKVNEAMDDIFQVERFSNRKDRLRTIFKKRYRSNFLYGDYVRWCFKKPFGYSGDFKIIEDIYHNKPCTTGFDRLWDNRFLELDASKSTRERKEDFKQILKDFLSKSKKNCSRIMNLASGSARELKELSETDAKDLLLNVTIDCCDFENKALEYAAQLLKESKNINFLQKNVIRLALATEITEEIPYKYDLIYSMGLFDYLEERIAIKLISNLKKILKQNGTIIITNYTAKENNTSAYLMEWLVEWGLIYRTAEEFKSLFINAGFQPKEIHLEQQKSKVMQYGFAQLS